MKLSVAVQLANGSNQRASLPSLLPTSVFLPSARPPLDNSRLKPPVYIVFLAPSAVSERIRSWCRRPSCRQRLPLHIPVS